MEVSSSQFWSSVLWGVTTLGTIVGLIGGFPQFLQTVIGLKTLRTNPNLYFVAFMIAIAAIVQCAIWIPGQAVNQQAAEMATEFDAILQIVSTKALREDEIQFYSEYLSAMMPAKIASICGKSDCDQYRKLLKHLKSETDSIQLHFHGLRPFVVRKRFIQDDTPMIGEWIELPRELAKELPTRKHEPEAIAQVAGNKEATTAPLSAAPPQLLPDNSNDTLAELYPAGIYPGGVPPTSPSIADSSLSASSAITPSPSNTVDQTSIQLGNFLAKEAWARCPHCGQRNTIKYQALSQYHLFSCARCGTLMDTSKFSGRVMKARSHIENRQ